MPEDEKEQGDPNKETMITPGEGDASEMLPSVGGYGDSEEPTPDTETETAKADTEDETAKDDTETDTGEDDPELAQLQEYGLDVTYKSVPAALAGIKEKDRYIEEQRVMHREQLAANQQLRDTLQRAYGDHQPAAVSEDMGELFATDPEKALQKMGFVNREQITPFIQKVQSVQARLEHQAFVGAVGQYDDLKDVKAHLQTRGVPPDRGVSPMWDAMDDIYRNSPSLSGADMIDLIPILYDAAKSRLTTGAKVSKVPASKKRGASTTSGGRGGRRPSGDEPDWDNMTEQEIYDLHKEKGLIS